MTVLLGPFFCAVVAFAAPQVVTDVDITRSSVVYNRQTETFDTTVQLRNTGVAVLAAPVRLVVEHVTPVTVSVYNMSGQTEHGKPYVEVSLPNFALEPGQVASVPVRFLHAGPAAIQASFTVRAERLEASAMAWLNIVARFGNEHGGTVGAGYAVQVDGTTRALTDATGTARIAVSTDATMVSVRLPPNMGYVRDTCNFSP